MKAVSVMLAVLTVIFVAVRVIIEIMPKKEREVKV